MFPHRTFYCPTVIILLAYSCCSALRHIRLTNTPECKPITNSRDTQELPYEAGTEVLQIFLDYQTKSKTSLLQDFAYYEVCLPFCFCILYSTDGVI